MQVIFRAKEKALALGISAAIFGLAAVVGQALGGVLVSPGITGLGWRTIFLVNFPVARLVLLIGIPLLKETRTRDARRLDFSGRALSMLTLGALLVALTVGREAGWRLCPGCHSSGCRGWRG